MRIRATSSPSLEEDENYPQAPSSTITIHWARDERRTTRIVDWVDEHPEDQDILFHASQAKQSSSEGEVTTKAQCCCLIARDVFAQDEDVNVRLIVGRNPQRYAGSILARLKWLKRHYQDINKALGADLACLPYEQFSKGTEPLKKLEKRSKGFPWWKRLHAYWRTNSSYNQFYQISAPISESRIVDRPRRLGALKVASVPGLTGVAKTTRLEELDEIEVINNPQRKSKGSKRKNSGDGRNERSSSELGTDQSHNDSEEIRLAELAFKRQKLANAALEKQGENLKIELAYKEKHLLLEIQLQKGRQDHERDMALVAAMGRKV